MFVYALLFVALRTALERLYNHRERTFVITDSCVGSAGVLSSSIARIAPETPGEAGVVETE